MTAPGYDTADAQHGLADVERAELCDLLEDVGPSAPTLCEGWDAAHLAAHLVMREGTPLGPLKLLRPNVAGEETQEMVATTEFDDLVDRLRAGPSSLSVFAAAKVNKLANSVEFFVHHEDVRRAQPEWSQRELPPWAEDELWSRIKPTSRLLLRKAPVGVGLQRADTGDRVFAVKKLDTVVVVGPPSEIALFVNGRTEAARVDLRGEPENAERLRAARMGM